MEVRIITNSPLWSLCNSTITTPKTLPLKYEGLGFRTTRVAQARERANGDRAAKPPADVWASGVLPQTLNPKP